jgi:hypothetical protein
MTLLNGAATFFARPLHSSRLLVRRTGVDTSQLLEALDQTGCGVIVGYLNATIRRRLREPLILVGR